MKINQKIHNPASVRGVILWPFQICIFGSVAHEQKTSLTVPGIICVEVDFDCKKQKASHLR